MYVLDKDMSALLKQLNSLRETTEEIPVLAYREFNNYFVCVGAFKFFPLHY